jgi:hypothetical protein
MRLALVATLALLSGCDGPALSDKQRSEVRSIAADYADGASTKAGMSAMDDRIAKMERRLEIAEGNDEFELKAISDVSKDGVQDAQAIADISKDFSDHMNRYHGQ